VFIGTSKEALEDGLLAKASLWVSEAGHVPLPWNTPGLFPPGSYAFQELQSAAADVGAAIFIFSEDDTTWYRGSKRTQPRDNVVLEYGLFVGRLDVSRVAICCKGKPAFASDLAGMTYIDLTHARKAKTEMLQWLTMVEKAARIPSTKVITCHTNKYAMDDSNGYWHSIRARAKHQLVIIGDTNKSWISRDPVESMELAQQLVGFVFTEGQGALISRREAEPSTMFFLRKYVVEAANEYGRPSRQEIKRKLHSHFCYGTTSTLNYKAVLSDDKIILLPNMVSHEFRDESLVIELNEATHPVEFGYYLQDIRRIRESSARRDLVKEIVSEIRA
jgi:hypothetical protein